MSSEQEHSDATRPDQGGDGPRHPEGGGERGGRHHRRRRPQQQRQQPSPQRRGESSLNMDELRELTDLFTAHGLTDFEFENSEIRVRLSRSLAPVASNQTAPPPSTGQPVTQPAPLNPQASESAPAAQSAKAEQEAGGAESVDEELHVIKSPIVGTFYRSPSPTAEPFVRAGSSVENDTVVCIIEAMKLMNEIQAEVSGIVEKIFVENGQPVEYNQPLFGIRKA